MAHGGGARSEWFTAGRTAALVPLLDEHRHTGAPAPQCNSQALSAASAHAYHLPPAPCAQAFSVFNCHSYELDAASGARISFLAADPSIKCDTDDPEYWLLWRTGVCFIGCVSALPLLYLVLLFRCRTAIVTHSPTRLSRGCRFLWHDYKDQFWWFEPLQQARKLFLTGFVMMFDEAMPNARALTAMTVTLSFLVVMIYIEPFRSTTDSRLFALQQMVLLVLFQAVTLIRLCDEQRLCRSFGFESSFSISMACAAWNLLLMGVVLSMIVYRALQQSQRATLRLHIGEPVLTLLPDHRYHIFLSHIW